MSSHLPRGPHKFPALLELGVNALIKDYPVHWLKRDVRGLAERLRDRQSVNIDSERRTSIEYSARDVLAYIVSRFPSTFGAVTTALQHVWLDDAQFAPKQVLDFGAGTGAGTLSVLSRLFPQSFWIDHDDRGDVVDFNGFSKVPPEHIPRLVQIEPNKHMQSAARFFASFLRFPDSMMPLQSTSLSGAVGSAIAPSDLSICSYVLNELSSQDEVKSVISDVLGNTTKYAVFIEPGTPGGFSSIRQLRDDPSFRAMGFVAVAPCPRSQLTCPMGSGSWCHFSTRLERPMVQRRFKEDFSRSLEDERLSFVVMKKEISLTEDALDVPRILGPPLKRSGHVVLDLCHPKGGIQRQIFSRSSVEDGAYRYARKSKWGDPMPFFFPVSSVPSKLEVDRARSEAEVDEEPESH
ncbi:mitochondrial small subunit ribosomal protein Rsm22 [Andalucia godoyi]|uniref:Mitochondrial small subunit ribosomal protein Rsm22 n=1 Tax=Andalucia godoyi TaxID=505711 RepID=A0A8K0AG50_ANDGO|nr:mitochondrial small subunit ribosomal protein Rsm22 [Andalucia godoyi]|eukprot:ANDGO_07862.mRNA.1 mitochondrial small subunit ribosomal protein Rsm22